MLDFIKNHKRNIKIKIKIEEKKYKQFLNTYMKEVSFKIKDLDSKVTFLDWKRYTKFLKLNEVIILLNKDKKGGEKEKKDNKKLLIFKKEVYGKNVKELHVEKRIIISEDEANKRPYKKQIGRFTYEEKSHGNRLKVLHWNEVLFEEYFNGYIKFIYKRNGQSYRVLTMEKLLEREKYYLRNLRYNCSHSEIDTDTEIKFLSDEHQKLCEKLKYFLTPNLENLFMNFM